MIYLQRKWKEVGINAFKSKTLWQLHKLGFKLRVPRTMLLLSSKQMAIRVKWDK